VADADDPAPGTPIRPAETIASNGEVGVTIVQDGASEPASAPGWREVLTVGAVVVLVVLALAVLTSILPTSLQDVVFHTPLAIVVLLVGTVGLLLWVARRPSPGV
jgi:uncharacterized integral membrane protein